MSKKMMVLAMAVACAALFALPAAASAQSWHNSSSGAASAFSVTGSGGNLTTPSNTVTCTKTTGSGSFSTTTGGTVSLLFEGCTAAGFAACNSPGQTGGKIAVHNSFDAIEPTKGSSSITPGVLLTPSSSEEHTAGSGKKFFVEFSCGFFFSSKVYGNGVIGTIHSPDPSCGVPSKTFGLNFESSAAGTQKDLTWTGTTYDLISRLNNEAGDSTASLDGTATMHFASSQTITCTL
jgi:hypothetical protein